MLKIKLARFGKRQHPHYRIVVNEARDKRDGSYVAQIGRYVPTENPKVLDFNVEEYKAWLKKGAQPTETVAGLFARFESGNPFPVKKAQFSRKAKAKQEAAAKQIDAAAQDSAVETPVEAAIVEEQPAAPTSAEKTE
ncbi:MAG: 30S ribosomal protein S16 [Patescibacteria group bacterium]